MAAVVNQALSNPVVNTAAFVSTAVLAGYCLQPVPDSISKLFNENHVVKFFVLFIMTVIAMTPSSDQQLGLIALVIIALLGSLEYYRSKDAKEGFSLKTEYNKVVDGVSDILSNFN